jgi:ABC-type Zn uptake system ZnuABC Zn-binding protein ZnuA
MRVITKDIRRKSLLLFTVVSLAGLMIHNLCSAAEPLDVYVVNYPLKYFSERIGDKHIQVTFPPPPNVDPAFWAPDITTITKYRTSFPMIVSGWSLKKF